MNYCLCKSIDPYHHNIVEGLNFLTDLFVNSTKQYSALNTARSALSIIMEPQYGITFGRQPIVKRFMRGVFKLRPSLPRYSFTYDIDIVLKYLESLGDPDKLPLKVLTYRTVTLLCIFSGQRDQTISSIDVFQPRKIVVFITERLKTSRPGHHVAPLEILKYDLSRNICLVENLKQ